ncbi:MAG TPA: hypothetical protein ENG97_00750 [Deltaproteobacteria bacterium]|nr:hypothetical protein [Deltaproteobacteria bacterium]
METVCISVPFEYRRTDSKSAAGDYSICPVIDKEGELWFSFIHTEIADIISSIGDSLRILLRSVSFLNGAKKVFLIGFINPDVKSLEGGGYHKFKAKQIHILKENDFLDITEAILSRGINKRVAKSNSINHPEYKNMLNDWLNYLTDKQDDSAIFIYDIKNSSKIKAVIDEKI